MMSSIPLPLRAQRDCTFIGGRSLHSLKPARTTGTEPTTKAHEKQTRCGPSPANVEYRSGKMRLSGHLLHCDVVKANRYPKER
jgi:hypothetical protein